MITSEYLPKSEQALRALDALTGDAALEVEEIPDSKYFRDDGIEILLKDLEVAFGEREIYRRGGLIREFENLSRMQGESVDAFVRRYKLYERKLQDAKIAAYPSETRAVKLLDGLRLSEQATSQLLLAAGNRYDMDAILNALKVQYPPGLTLTGLTRHPTAISTHVKGRGRGNHGRGRSRSGGSFKWRTWHTEAQEDEMPEDNTVPETFTGYEAYEISNDIALENANDLLDDVFEYQFDDYEADLEEGLPEQAPEEGYDDGPEEQAEALTATSKKMASATQSRGYYLSAAAKGKGKGGGGKGKDKGDGKKGFGSSSSSSTSFQKGKGLGKPSKGSTKGSGKGGGKNKSSTQRHRLQASLCLGCDSSEHWLRDCPHVTQHQAHVCASSTTLDGEGMVVWMVGHNKMPLDAEDDLATHGLEEFLPEGMNPDDALDAADEWTLWQMEAHQANEFLERQAASSAAPSFHTAVTGPSSSEWRSCDTPPPSSSQGDPEDFMDALDDAYFWRLEAEGCLSELRRLEQEEQNKGARTQGPQERKQNSGVRTQEPQEHNSGKQTQELQEARGPGTRTQGPQEHRLPVGSSHVSPVTLAGTPYLAPRAPLSDPPRIRLFEEWPSSDDISGMPRREPSVRLLRHPSGAASATCLLRQANASVLVTTSSPTPSQTTLTPQTASSCAALEPEAPNEEGETEELPPSLSVTIPSMTTYVQYSQEPALVIIDTGCQRQVAGKHWHAAHHELLQMPRLAFPEKCQFKFGPNRGTSSTTRYAYPSGMGGHFTVLFFSCVSDDAPALMSRNTLATLDGLVDICRGEVIYQALQTKSPLYLTSCGHLAVRIDEWPSTMPSWPCTMQGIDDEQNLPDIWAPAALPVQASALPSARFPLQRPPLADAGQDSTVMASSMEAAADTPLQLHEQGAEDGVGLCRNLDEPQSSGPCAAADATLYGSDYDEHRSFVIGAGLAQPHHLRGQARGLSPSTRTSCLRGRRTVCQDLRHVRFSSSSPQRTNGPSGSKSQPTCEDALGSAGPCCQSFQVQGQKQSAEQVRRKSWFIRTVAFWFGTFLAFLSGLLLDSVSGTGSSPSQAGGGTCSQASGGAGAEALGAFGAEGCGSTATADGGGSGFEHELGSDWWRPLVESSLMGDRPRPPGGGGLRLEPGGQRRGDRRPRADLRADESGRIRPLIHGSADWPLTFEDRGLTWLKPGKQKRLLGTIRQMQQLWMVELSIYDTLVQQSRWLRRSKADLVEIYAGHGNISEYALGKGLRVLQPVDKVFGTELNTKEDFDWLIQSLSYWKPLLTVVEPECRLWSSLTNLNYFWRPDELAQLRDEAQVTVEGVARLLRNSLDDGRLFLLENPHAGKFWSQPAIVKLVNDYQLFYDYGEMCMYNLRGRDGHLIRKPTGWLTNKAELLQAVNCKCNGNHEHEPCMGSNSKLAAVYTRTLAKSVVDKFLVLLQAAGDERFRLSTSWPASTTSYPTSSSSRAPRTPSRAPATTVPAPGTPRPMPGTPRPGMLETTEAEEPYADLKQDIDAWRPLLKEAAERLEGKVAVSAEVKPGAFLEQIKALVPWRIAYTQIYRTPKMRRLPTRRMLDLPFSYRAAVLLFADGTITIESESIADLANPNARFEKNVRVGIFIYGDPVSLSSSQHRARASIPPPLPEPEETAVDDWKIPDISFPGISEDQTPKWMQGVLRRVHSNLGHPPQSVMVRMLAQAGAAPAALIGARALRCGVCKRAKPLKEARPAKAVDPKRFNQRLMLDLVFCKDAAGETFTFLNQLDEATTYQALTLIPNRESGTINQVLIKGWFQFFGLPETLLIDVEGALKSFSFEELMAQSNVAVRYVPPDAHYQLGKCERHGAIARAILRKLIDEHGLIGADDMTTGAVMACHAKNSLARRAGCAPAQWVFGQLPRLPASVLSEADNPEAMELTSLSSKLQRTEQLRYAALQAFLSFDNDDQLRRSILRKSRPWRGPFEVGMKIVYYRLRNNLDNEGAQPGYRQGIIVGIDPGVNGSLWVRNDRGRLVQVAREQARTLAGQELWIPDHQDLAILRSAEQDLSKKHAAAHDLRDALPPPDDQAAPLPQHDPVQLPALPEPLPVEADAPVEKTAPSRRPSLVPSVVLEPLDASGQPLDEPSSASVPSGILAPASPRDAAVASRRSSTATDGPLDVKRIKTSAAPSVRSSASDVPDLPTSFSRQSSVQARQVSQGTEVLPPVPEDDDLMADPIPPEPRDELPSEMTLDQTNAVSFTEYETYTISAKSFCKFCGCREKQLCSGRLQCCRCLCFEFTDHPGDVQSWFDEDVEFDSRTRSWRSSQLALTEDLHLPQQEELQAAWISGTWQNNEIHRSPSKEPGSSTTGSALKSVACWSTTEEQWSWLTLANVETDLDVNDFDLNKKMVIYHAPRRDRKKLDQETLLQQRRLYGHHQPQQVWLLRHGRQGALQNGWDGTPSERQTLFDGQQHFMMASHLADWLDAQANLVSYSETAETFQTYLLNGTTNNIKMQDTSDEEDGGLKRTQRQALKRELPWRPIPAADWPAFIESITKEWNEWKKWSSCTKFTGDPSTIPKHLILPSRVCYRWKPIDGGTSHKAKARIVIQGFRDPHLPLLSRDAPVLSRIGLMALLQWAASMGTDLVNGDCKSAFLQGKPDDEGPEKIYMRVPQDGISLAAIEDWNNAPDTLYQLTAPVYGAANAPRRWYIHVRETMENLGWQVHSLDPCLFLKLNGTKVIAVLGIHVDDILASSMEPGVLKEVEGSFTWGSEWEVNDFVFIGRRIVKHSNHTITLSQSHYAADVFVSRVKGDANEPIGNNQELMSEFRSAIGSLQWMSGTTRPDIASETSLLQKAQAELTLQDLMDANTTLRYIKATADSHIMVKPIPLENLVLISYGDAAFGNAPGGKSQGGYLVLASTEEALHGEAEASLLDWKSFRHQRVLRSTLAAEAASLDRSEDSANFIGCLLGELVIEGYVASHSSRSPFPVWPVTDARSLYDSIHRLATTFSEKRVEMDVAALRSTCRNLRWVPTGEMKADALTKRSSALRDALRKWAQNPTVSLTEARDPDTSLDPNAPWRPVKATKNVTSANLMSCS